jgi:hypothetical protein
MSCTTFSGDYCHGPREKWRSKESSVVNHTASHFLGGMQARISQTTFCKSPDYFKANFKDFVLTKAESAQIVAFLNKAISLPRSLS